MKIEERVGKEVVRATVHVAVTVSESRVGVDGGEGDLEDLRKKMGLGHNALYEPHITLARRGLSGRELDWAG